MPAKPFGKVQLRAGNSGSVCLIFYAYPLVKWENDAVFKSLSELFLM